MNFVQRFTFLFSAPTFEAEDLEGLRVAEIIAAIQRMGFQVIRAPRIEDAEIAVQTDAAIGCLVVDWGKKGLEGKAASLINVMRRRGLEMPIVLLVRRKRFEDVPVGIGRVLLPALIDACAAAGYRQMIGYIEAGNAPSLKLHASCGFK